MIKFYNGYILSMQDGMDIVSAELWVDGDTISYIGAPRNDEPEFSRMIDLQGDIIMPTFKNAHTHSAMTFLRSFADDLPLHEWLFDKVFPIEAGLTPAAIYAFAKLAIAEYLSSGIGASFDMYFYRDAYVKANMDAKFRTVLCGVGSAGDAKSKNLELEHEKFNNISPLITHKLGFHAEYTADEELLLYVSKLAHEYKAPVYTHNSETEREVKDCIERHGMTPTAYFESLGLFDFGGGGFHCTWLSDEDIEIFKKRNLFVVSCPASNAKLASGIAPLHKFKDAGLNLALGTDGPASNNSLDMFREMYLACILQKLQHMDSAACPASDILHAATVGSAQAMGLFDCDTLSVGKKADIIRIDMKKPNMQPITNPAVNLVYSGSPQNIKMTMINGEVLYENGEFFLDEDINTIYENAERLKKELIYGNQK